MHFPHGWHGPKYLEYLLLPLHGEITGSQIRSGTAGTPTSTPKRVAGIKGRVSETPRRSSTFQIILIDSTFKIIILILIFEIAYFAIHPRVGGPVVPLDKELNK